MTLPKRQGFQRQQSVAGLKSKSIILQFQDLTRPHFEQAGFLMISRMENPLNGKTL